MRLICVVMNCSQENEKWFDAARLFEYGFTRYADAHAYELLQRAARAFNTVEIEEAAEGTESLELNLYEVDDGGAMVKVIRDSDVSMDTISAQMAETAEINWTRELKAPVGTGEIMGNVRCTLPGGGEVKALLVAARDVAAPATPEPVVVTEAPRPVQTASAPIAEPAPVPVRRTGSPVLIIGFLVLLLACAIAAVVAINSARRRKARRRRRRSKGTRR